MADCRHSNLSLLASAAAAMRTKRPEFAGTVICALPVLYARSASMVICWAETEEETSTEPPEVLP